MSLFHAAILGLILSAPAGLLADLIFVGVRKLWRHYRESRSIARTARLCRLYGFSSPLSDERNSIDVFKQLQKR